MHVLDGLLCQRLGLTNRTPTLKMKTMTPFFTTLTDFLTMGGHAPYVFACYGLTLLCVVVGIVWVKAERNKFLKTLARQQTRQKNKNS